MTVGEHVKTDLERRRRAVEHARHEVRLEGLKPDPATEPLFEQYVEGTLSGDELRARLIAHYTQK